ncbi:hypothetical protein SDC9_105354 [bioreactor metagenome]|uniref:Uncharacterized protein n=1 Tax=bioreactor metagenome TaxID=1076179 RepID=A0A645B5V8_9ZZZZ
MNQPVVGVEIYELSPVLVGFRKITVSFVFQEALGRSHLHEPDMIRISEFPPLRALGFIPYVESPHPIYKLGKLRIRKNCSAYGAREKGPQSFDLCTEKILKIAAGKA